MHTRNRKKNRIQERSCWNSKRFPWWRDERRERARASLSETIHSQPSGSLLFAIRQRNGNVRMCFGVTTNWWNIFIASRRSAFSQKYANDRAAKGTIPPLIFCVFASKIGGTKHAKKMYIVSITSPPLADCKYSTRSTMCACSSPFI